MAAAPLTSNHVNYLIWRYLQESGHDRTAARLQRDWKIGDPETLPFARHIKTHALVSLVQKGLQYHELENAVQQNGEKATQTPTTLFFGTEFAEAPKGDDEAVSNLKAPASPSKRGRESYAPSSAQDASSAPASKRRRAGKDAARSTPAKSSDEMDVDPPTSNTNHATTNDATSRRQSDNTQLVNGSADAIDAELSRASTGAGPAAVGLAVEPPAAPPPVKSTRDLGRSVPTQTDAVAQIGDGTTRVIELGAGKIALKTVWNPQQPGLLASAGDKLCGIWSVPSGSGLTAKTAASPNSPANGLSATSDAATRTPQQQKLFESSGPSMDKAAITAIAWTSDGEYLAAARTSDELDEASAVTIFDRSGAEITQMGKGQRFFFGLTFNPSGNLLLGFGADNSHYSDQSRDFGLCVWDISDDDPEMSSSTAHKQVIEGAAWLDDRNIIVCGPGYIAETVYENRTLQPLRVLPLDNARGSDAEDPLEWSYMEYDKYTGTCILSDESRGQLGLLSADRKSLQTVQAHDGEIRGIQYQPLPQHGSSGDGPRLVATASTDGSVKMWDVSNDKIRLQRTFYCNSVDPARQPALAMQFSPDGGYLAVATSSRVYFWRPEKEGAWPFAEWSLDRTTTGWRDGSSLVKHEMDGDVRINGNAAAETNGVNGHAQPQVQNNGATMPSADTVVNEADREKMDVSTDASKDDNEGQTPTLAWSAMGKKIAYGYREQIAIADFVTVGRL